MPDADFASAYSPAIAAAFTSYADLPNPAAARRALLLALKAALKRRRAFILPRFTQAEDSWRIRECASYAVAVAVLVEHTSLIIGANPKTTFQRLIANGAIPPVELGGTSGRMCNQDDKLRRCLVVEFVHQTALVKQLEILH